MKQFRKDIAVAGLVCAVATLVIISLQAIS